MLHRLDVVDAAARESTRLVKYSRGRFVMFIPSQALRPEPPEALHRAARRPEAYPEDRICLRVEINQLIRFFERAAN